MESEVTTDLCLAGTRLPQIVPCGSHTPTEAGECAGRRPPACRFANSGVFRLYSPAWCSVRRQSYRKRIVWDGDELVVKDNV